MLELYQCSHQAQSIDNLRVYLADANDVLGGPSCSRASTGCSRISLILGTRKHNKRRIQPQFVQLVRQQIALQRYLHMVRSQPYAEQMLETLDQAEGFENTAGIGNYALRPAYRPMTKFERRGERLGHGVWDLIYQKTD